MRARSLPVRLALWAILVSGCGQDATVKATRDWGTLRMPLSATTPDGTEYQLTGNLLVESYPSGTYSETIDISGGDGVYALELPQGNYTAQLLDGWQLLRKQTDDTLAPANPVRLISDNPVSFSIDAGRITEVLLRFGVGSDFITLSHGRADIRVDVIEGLIRYRFAGFVIDSGGVYGVGDGDRINGMLSFDPGLQDEIFEDPKRADYIAPILYPYIDLTVQLGNLHAASVSQSSDGVLHVYDNYVANEDPSKPTLVIPVADAPVDGFTVHLPALRVREYAEDPEAIPPGQETAFDIRLWATEDLDAFSSDALPETLDLSRFNHAEFTFGGGTGTSIGIITGFQRITGQP